MKECPKCHNAVAEYYSAKNHWCKECSKAYQREWHAKNKDTPGFSTKRKSQELKWRYGITLEEREQMIIEQNGKCAICGVHVDSKAHTDHCHTTGKVRGILCTTCNRGLGYFKDSAEIIQNAIRYLEKHESPA